jgi:hypothetical protein
MASINFRTHVFSTEPEGDLEFCNGMPGSQVAGWVRDALLKKGYKCREPIQEDYGWGFWVEADGCRIWVSAGNVGVPGGEQEDPPEWYVGVDHDFPPWALRQWFRMHRGREVVREIFAVVKGLIASHPEVSVQAEE